MAFLMYSTTKDSKNMRPSQEDLILLLNAPKTPFLVSVKKGKKPNRLLHEYFARTAPAAVTTSVADGTDRSASDAADFESLKVRMRIRPHYRDRVVGIGAMTDAAEDQNGISDLHLDNIQTAQKALTRDIENVLLGLQDSAISTNTHTTRGMGCWTGLTSVTDSTDCPIDSSVDVASAAVINLGTDAAASTVTEANLRTLLQAIFEESREPIPNARGLCTPSMKSAISNFCANLSYSQADTTGAHTVNEVARTFTQPTGDTSLKMVIDRYTGDFGSIELIPTTELPTGTTTTVKYPYLYVYDPDVWSYLPLLPMAVIPVPRNTGGKVDVVRASFFLKCASPMRNGVIHWTKS